MEQDSYQTKAMVEVALALAMGFFSIMVLAMVSMGAVVGPQPATVGLPSPISMAASAPNNQAPRNAKGPGTPVAPTDLIIFHDGQFLGADLRPVDPLARPVGRAKVVLAVAPDMDFSTVMSARRQISGTNVTVTNLDSRWLKRLREHGTANQASRMGKD
jgi:hypothetical protein